MKHIFLLLNIFIVINLNSQELEKTKWLIQWGKFETLNVSVSNQFLATTIPNYFLENIQLGINHFPNNEESILVLNKEKNNKITALKSKLSDKLSARDEYLFDIIKKPNDSYTKIDKEIKELNDNISEYEDIKVNQLPQLSNIPIEYFPKDKKLVSIKSSQIKYYLEQNNIDYYISGIIEEVSDNIILKVLLFSRYTKEPRIIWSGIGSSEEILSYKDEILDSISKNIFSEDIISYSIETIPGDALIYVNDTFRALGKYNGYNTGLELLNIRISKEGYKPISIKKDINNLTTSLDFELIPVKEEMILIESIPTGSKAYYGSKYIGFTPLEVPVYSFSQKLTITADGYMDKSIIINEYSKDLKIKLKKDILDRDQNFINQKKSFYTSTAIFSFAVAIPLYLNIQDDNINSTIINVSMGNAIFWGLNLFYRLYQYLKAAEISVE